MKYREIERMTGVSHNTVIVWVKQSQKIYTSSDSDDEDADLA